MAVPVTATDLYIHGRGGFVVEQLNCGMGIIIDGVPPNGDHDGCATKTTPIARNYEFDVCLPPAHPGGTLTWTVEPGPGNSIAVDPVITERTPAGAACQGSFDTQKMLHVVVPLAGSGAVPEDVYAHFSMGLKTIQRIDDRQAIVEKQAEVLRESRAFHVDACQNDISLMTDAMRSRAKRRKDDASALPFERTIEYSVQIGAKSAKTRKRKSGKDTVEVPEAALDHEQGAEIVDLMDVLKRSLSGDTAQRPRRRKKTS